VNGDGFADVLLGYEDHSRTMFRQGRVVLFQGSPSGLRAMPSWAFEGTQEYSRLGRTMGSAGSINADDLSDIIVGVSGYGGNQFEEGQALIFAGAANGMSARPVWAVEGDHVWRGFGVPVSGAGDVDGDGYDDVLVGGNGEQSWSPPRVYLGGAAGLSVQPAWHGFPVDQLAAAGDVNGDGYDDVLLGLARFEDGRFPYRIEEGLVALYHGSESGLESVPHWQIEGNASRAHLGSSVAGAGDINGDGYDDVLVGSSAGTHVHYGTAEGLTTRSGILLPAYDGRAAGDVNGDGFDDVIFMGPPAHTATVHLGSPWGLAREPIWSVVIDTTNHWGAVSAGDVNGDGLDDLIARSQTDAYSLLSIGCDPCGSWPSHGAYVRCVGNSLNRLLSAGAISEEQATTQTSTAAQSRVGHRGFRPSGCAFPTTCGDGVAEGAEVCDGPALRQETCATQDYDGGSLACNATCTGFDLAGCTTHCGDGRRRGHEICDGSDVGALSCESQGYDLGLLSCNSTCDGLLTHGCGFAVCGDDMIHGQELCDGDMVPSAASCILLGLGDPPAGTRCNDDCQLDIINCFWMNPGPTCGDGSVLGASHGTYRESCDGHLLKNQTCKTLGFTDGSLSCKASCRGFELTGCTGGCGNDLVEDGEICDGTDLAGATCTNLGRGFTGGTLGCNALCNGYEYSGCCGDNMRSALELCDGTDLGGQTCESQGYRGGSLACASSCDRFDISACFQCGNDVTETGETCDGQDIGSTQCSDLGFSGGILRCASTCGSFDLSACVGGCGNGVIEDDETCDTSALGGQSCLTLGYDSGSLQCSASCDAFNVSGCLN